MFNRYTDEAKRAIYFAEVEAWHRRCEFVTARELLVALTWHANSRADRVASLNSQAVNLRAAFEVPHLPTTPVSCSREDKQLIPLDSDCKKILAYAAIEADKDGEFWIDSDYLLRGVLRVPSLAEETLQKFGITRPGVKAASVADRKKHPPKAAPRLGAIKMFLSRDRGIWLFAPLLLFILFLIRFIEWWFGPSR